MEVVKLFKEVINFAQKSNDIDMIQKIISAQQDMLELQEENKSLKEENRRLKSKKSIKNKIERYKNINVITLKDDNQKIKYCSNCWDNNEKLVQLHIIDNDRYACNTCKTIGYQSDSPDWDKLR